MSFAPAQDGIEKETIRGRLGMGQYGLALGVLLYGIRDRKAVLTCDTQHTLHICRWPRARKELDRPVQAGQGLGDDT
jgi:hypothetical protein